METHQATAVSNDLSKYTVVIQEAAEVKKFLVLELL